MRTKKHFSKKLFLVLSRNAKRLSGDSTDCGEKRRGNDVALTLIEIRYM